MRQVPHSFLILGSGRVSKHIGHYFNLLKIPFHHWNRKNHTPQRLQDLVRISTHIFMAVSDQALSEFENQILEICVDLPKAPKIFHFSGATSLKQAVALHPLMSFGPELYDLKTYQDIHFVAFPKSEIPNTSDRLNSFIPELHNKMTVLSEDHQARYHSLCVLGGNFPVLLWNKMESEFSEFGIPSKASHTYIQQIEKNYIGHGKQALTGPLVRNDQMTIEKNLAALKNDPYQTVYEAFRKVFENAHKS